MPSEVALDWGASQDSFGLQLSRGEIVYPSLKVLPMGWTWSLWIVQVMREEFVRGAGYQREQCLVSGWPVPRLPPPGRDRTSGLTMEAKLSTGP
eukprot:5799243-Heterocapsa_arctica.AAC.1